MSPFSFVIHTFINIHLFTSTTYAAEIWNEPMDTGVVPGANWVDTPTTALVLRSNDNGCPQAATGGSGLDKCWAICTGNNQPGEPTVYRNESTVGFKNIMLTFDLDPWANSQKPEERMCVVEYSTNGGQLYTLLYSTLNGSEHIMGRTESLGVDANEAASVRIRVRLINQNMGKHSSSCGVGCYISNFILSGDIVTNDPTIDPTSDPTKDPTTNPTSDPTKDPTTDPTSDPTAVPTMLTNDPTKSPTDSSEEDSSDEDCCSCCVSLNLQGQNDDNEQGTSFEGVASIFESQSVANTISKDDRICVVHWNSNQLWIIVLMIIALIVETNFLCCWFCVSKNRTLRMHNINDHEDQPCNNPNVV